MSDEQKKAKKLTTKQIWIAPILDKPQALEIVRLASRDLICLFTLPLVLSAIASSMSGDFKLLYMYLPVFIIIGGIALWLRRRNSAIAGILLAIMIWATTINLILQVINRASSSSILSMSFGVALSWMIWRALLAIWKLRKVFI